MLISYSYVSHYQRDPEGKICPPPFSAHSSAGLHRWIHGFSKIASSDQVPLRQIVFWGGSSTDANKSCLVYLIWTIHDNPMKIPWIVNDMSNIWIGNSIVLLTIYGILPKMKFHTIWVCLKMWCKPLNPMVLLISIPFLNMAISLGILTQHFQTNPHDFMSSQIFAGQLHLRKHRFKPSWSKVDLRKMPFFFCTILRSLRSPATHN